VNTTYTAIFRTASAITVPGSPDGLTATVNGQGVALGWTAALGAMTYRVEAGSAPGLANLFNADVGDVTLLQATAGPGAYFVRVRAANTIGVGPPSNEVRVTIDGGAACVTPPPAPANFSVQAAGLSAAFSWAPAPNATSYVLDVGSASGQSNLLSANVGAGTGYAAAGPAGTYYTRLRAVNACGASGPSQEAALTLGCTSAVPGPTGLTAIKANGILTLRWVGALGASSYRVRAGDGAGRTNLLDSDLGPATVQQFNLAGVPPGPYFVTIAAVGACGVSGASNEVLVQVP
jgi:predicted phage tail protein